MTKDEAIKKAKIETELFAETRTCSFHNFVLCRRDCAQLIHGCERQKWDDDMDNLIDDWEIREPYCNRT